MRFIQGRDPDWVHRPFFAKFDPQATWLSELEPAFGDSFYFEDSLDQYYHEDLQTAHVEDYE